MNLTSFEFIIFIFIFLFIYFIVPKKIQWITNLLASIMILFYNNFSLKIVGYVLIILFSAYLGTILFEKKPDKKRYIFVPIIIILLELTYLKYSNLFISTINIFFKFFHINNQLSLVYRAVPIGLSYYSLIMIGYIIDVYRGICKPQKNIFKCALFLSYFPLLNSGPFVRYDNMCNQLYQYHKFDFNNLTRGFLRFLWGLFKILVISQRIGIFVDTVYGNLVEFNGVYVILAILLYTIQLYTNFSGSIDIIMGISETMGIKLPENFTSPFLSKTITEFWRNWHITLGNWLKDYIFYPLLKSTFMQKIMQFCKKKFGKKVGKKIPTYISMFILWLTIGIWHGGAYTYILASGLLQFLFIMCEDLFIPVSKKINKIFKIDTDKFSYKLFQMIRTYILFSLSMVFFRAENISSGIEVLKNIFVFNPWVLLDHSSLYLAGLNNYNFYILNLAIIILFIIEYLKTKFDIREKLLEQNLMFRWGLIYILIFSIVIFGCYGAGYETTTFIYRQF